MLSKDDYYQSIARTVAARGNCIGRLVGAVAVREDRIVATGYNGVPVGMPNCLDGGCTRCAKREKFASGTAYDLCICVHAEANAMAMAARLGIALDGSTLYSTHQPCFGCAKELLQAGIVRVIYESPWPPNEEVREDYERLQSALAAQQRVPTESPVAFPDR